MGTPKARLSFCGTPLLHRVLAIHRQVAAHTVVVTAPALPLGIPTGPELTIVADLQPQMGPLMALYTGLSASKTERNIVTGCDMPFLNTRLLRRLIEHSQGWDIAVPVHSGRPQYLHAVYSRSCMPAMERLIASDSRKLGLLIREVRTRYVPPEEWADDDPEGLSFVNLNTPADLYDAEALASRTAVAS